MGVANERFQEGNVFIDYDFEEVMFRYDFLNKQFFRKFYGEVEEDIIPFDNRLLKDAIRSGNETDKNTYIAGKPKSDI